MEEKRTVTIDLDRYDELLRDSYDLEQAKAQIENIRVMVLKEIAEDCRKYGDGYANGTVTAIMCNKIFHEIGICNPSNTFLVQDALKEYEAKKAEEEERKKREARKEA
jgi:hypothetical protein